MSRDQSDPFPPDGNAPRQRIVRGRSDPFPVDPNAPPRQPDRAARHPAPAAGAGALRNFDALERELAQLHLIGPAVGAELRRTVHGDREHDEAPTPTDRPDTRRASAGRVVAPRLLATAASDEPRQAVGAANTATGMTANPTIGSHPKPARRRAMLALAALLVALVAGLLALGSPASAANRRPGFGCPRGGSGPGAVVVRLRQRPAVHHRLGSARLRQT